VTLPVQRIEDPAVQALYARRFVLVRPDGHVAWRGDTLHATPVSLVEKVLGHEKPPTAVTSPVVQ